jgi:hypothetical protein
MQLHQAKTKKQREIFCEPSSKVVKHPVSKTLVRPVIMYALETWTLTKIEDLYAHLKEGSSDASSELCWRMESGVDIFEEPDIVKCI